MRKRGRYNYGSPCHMVSSHLHQVKDSEYSGLRLRGLMGIIFGWGRKRGLMDYTLVCRASFGNQAGFVCAGVIAFTENGPNLKVEYSNAHVAEIFYSCYSSIPASLSSLSNSSKALSTSSSKAFKASGLIFSLSTTLSCFSCPPSAVASFKLGLAPSPRIG